MSSPSKRQETDVMKLMISDHKVDKSNDSPGELFVEFHGPPNSPYAGGVWKVRVDLPENYPFNAPTIRFVNRIYHPSIDEESGHLCQDVIEHEWNPMYDLLRIFESFLPKVLVDPNPSYLLNEEAKMLMMKEPDAYEEKIRDYCARYAKPEHVMDDPDEGEESEGNDEEDDDDEEEEEEEKGKEEGEED